MKKYLPYLAIALILLVGAFIYVQKTGKNVPLLSANTQIFDRDSNDADTGADVSADASSEEKQFLINYGPAPELSGITKWLNGDAQSIADQKGKVVLVNFWNYSSINSVRAFPHLTRWADSYRDQGLTIIGVHTPEFAFEKVTANVENAIKAHHLNYVVAQDNNYKTWQVYRNQFWPAYYLIDKDGNLVYSHFGEGRYEDTERAIRILLGLEGEYVTPPPAPGSLAKTPEIHLGTVRMNAFASNEKPTTNEQIYTFPKKLPANKFAFEGQWRFDQESAIHTGGFSKIKLNFDASKVFLVAEAVQETTIRIYVDGNMIKGVVVKDSDVYQLYDSLVGGPHTMEIEIPKKGFKAYTFTFD